MLAPRSSAPSHDVTLTRLLIVEGEHRAGRRLRRRLRGVAGWQVEVVKSVDAAVTAAAHGPFDVVVTERRPRGGSAADLLGHVKAAVPSSVRILLADDLRGGTSLARVAHQVLSVDVEADEMVRVVGEVSNVLGLLARDGLRSLVTEVDRLPGAPRLHLELAQLTEDPNVDLGDVAALIQKDAAIASKILQLVNSAFFGRAVRTADLVEATAFLGLTALRGLVLQNELMRAFRTTDSKRNRFLEDFNRHSYDVAMGARDLATPEDASEAFTAGLLHDVGQLVIASQRPYEWERIRSEVAATRSSLVDVERAHLGATHADIGAALLSLWALPYGVVQAVAHHHTPRESGYRFGLTGAVHVADADRNAGGSGPSFDHGSVRDDVWYERTGASQRVDV